MSAQSSIDPAEVERFSRIAAEWWDPRGKFAPLHRFNPVRLAFIRDQALHRFGRDGAARRPFEGLRLLDIGCGGGLLAEPMSRLGFSVTAVDASERNIAVAGAHATALEISIDYRCATAEALLDQGEPPFDVILNMEVIEHVADPESFLEACGQMLKPGGMMILATINRTPKAYALAIVAAERILRWVPRGTHDYKKLVKPAELEAGLARAGLGVTRRSGVTYDPLTDLWRLSSDLDVNYMMAAVKSGG